ncbi:MAG: Wzz/FepE/Etk N-terminal domain-containing protein [Patescibacteria group bacterium]
MELREYFKIIGKYWKVFWGVIIIAIVATLVFTKMQPKSYLAATTLTVNKASSLKQSQISYYLFDNYYNVQSSGLYSQIVATWFESPAVVKDIYTKADLTLPDVSQSKLSKIFKAVREEPATINVSISSSNKDEAEKLINAAAVVMQEKTNEMGRSDKENVYDIVKFEPVVTETTPNLWLNILISTIAGIIIGAILALAVDYFKAEGKNTKSN